MTPPAQARHTRSVKVELPVKWHDRLRELAAEQAISVSALVRIFLRAGLYGEGPPK